MKQETILAERPYVRHLRFADIYVASVYSLSDSGAWSTKQGKSLQMFRVFRE